MTYPTPPPQRPTYSTLTTSSGIRPAAPTPPKRRSRRWLALPIAAAVVAAGFGGGLIASSVQNDPAPVVFQQARPERVITAQPASSTVTPDTAAVGTTVIPSIVTVEVGNVTNGSFAVTGSGSGVVLDVDGNIATNDHVVAGGSEARVILSDGRIYDAELVGTDPLTDLAVLKVSTGDLTPMRLVRPMTW